MPALNAFAITFSDRFSVAETYCHPVTGACQRGAQPTTARDRAERPPLAGVDETDIYWSETVGQATSCRPGRGGLRRAGRVPRPVWGTGVQPGYGNHQEDHRGNAHHRECWGQPDPGSSRPRFGTAVSVASTMRATTLSEEVRGRPPRSCRGARG